MNVFYKYCLLFTFTWLTSQTIKYLIRLSKAQKFSLQEMYHIYVYGSGAPSSHAAVLTASLLFVIRILGIEHPISIVFTLLILLWLYELVLQRKRHMALEKMLAHLKISKKDLFLLKDLSGHDHIDIFWGIFVGIGAYILFSKIIYTQ